MLPAQSFVNFAIPVAVLAAHRKFFLLGCPGNPDKLRPPMALPLVTRPMSH
jgi:hypothetical protein